MNSLPGHPWNVRAVGGPLRSPNAEVVARSLSILIDRDQTFQILSTPSCRSRRFCGVEIDAAVEYVKSVSDDRSIFYTINALQPGLNRPAKNMHVIRRRFMMIDVDPIRAEGFSDGMASDFEVAEATRVALSVMDRLKSLRWPDPIVIDSGNGVQLLYAVDLPNDGLSRSWIAGALKVLSGEFSCATAHIDRSVHNAARLGKLPGTWNCKGPNTPERPHRISQIMSVPMEIRTVPGEMIAALAGLGGTDPEPSRPTTRPKPADPWKVKASNEADPRASYVRKALEGECLKVLQGVKDVDRNIKLNEAAFLMGTLDHLGAVPTSEILNALASAARGVGLEPGEIERTLNSGFTGGQAQPRQVEFQAEKPSRMGKPKGQPDPPPVEPDEAVTLVASGIKPTVVKWLWPGRIPLGKLTTFAGWGGLGKSFVTMDIAARVSRGDEWPSLAGECADIGDILILNTEDDPADTTVPRLIECGADLSRIRFLTTLRLGSFTLDDLDLLGKALGETDNPKLIVIDPVTAHLGAADDHKNAQLRALLAPLSLFAAEREISIILVTHVTKPTAHKTEAAARVMGSVAWVNAVRSAFMFTKDPQDQGRRLFMSIKNNLASAPTGLAYRVVPTETLARVEWEGEVNTTLDEAMEHSGPTRRTIKASEWLTERFKIDKEIPSSQIIEEAKKAGVSRNALFDAKEAMSIKAKQSKGGWIWVWPETLNPPVGSDQPF